MRRLFLLLLLCLGLTGMAPMRATAPSPAVSHGHALGGMGHCGGDVRCVHGACLGCALEPDLPRLTSRPRVAGRQPILRPVVAVLSSRSLSLEPPPPRRG